jgi:hypothetical protein
MYKIVKMKKIYLSVLAMSLGSLSFGQSFLEYTEYRGAFAPAPTAAWTDAWTNWDPQTTTYPAATSTVSANITTDTYWSNDQVYLIQGQIYVKNGATLTIQEGTTILGDKNSVGAGLFITKGSKLNALGTAAKPIVFTSNQPAGDRAAGDWGGIILLGKATTNAPGGIGNIEGIAPTADTEFGGALTPDDNDNSGDIRFVRIEYAGYLYAPNKEINGFTLGAVGSKTSIHHVQVSFSNDDAYEWFGGTVNCKHLVSYRNLDDDFDTDNGFSGKVQFGLVVRDPQMADNPSVSTSEGFESDNDASGSTATPQTSATFSNITLVGPLRGDVGSTVASGYKRGARIRRNSALKIYNSLFLDFKTGIHIDGVLSEGNAQGGSLKFKNNVIAGNLTNGVCETSKVGTAPNQTPSAFTTIRTWFGTELNDSVASSANILTTPYNFTAPDFRPTTNSIALRNVNHDIAGISAGIEEVSLFENVMIYPNPTQGNATLEVTLLNDSKINVSIFDISGKEIANVINGNLNAGENQLELNTTNLSNGIYYTRISGENTIKTIKFIVSK